MNQPPPNIPFYLQMVSLLRNALDSLDGQGQQEVFQFLESQQNVDGGFQDRGGRSDLYYSLFGMLLLGAWGVGRGTELPELVEGSDQSQCSVDNKSEVRSPKSEDEKANAKEPFPELVEGNPQLGTWNLELETKLKHFIGHQSAIKVPGFIEQCCLALLQKELKISRFPRIRTLAKLSRSFWKERHSINLSYRSFVLFLTLDAVLPFRGLLQRFSGKMLARVEVNEHSPCSEIAAKVFLLKMLGKDGSDERQLLISFASESGGFRAFQHLEQADMLSTAVALFALKNADCDIRILTPGCLDFIQQNFVDGAFLSGDGDQTADLEYTFYGLLALGALAE
jgi:hypothetical protein